MRLLLDSHVFIWSVGFPGRLSARARATIEDGENEVLLSAASAWELAIKAGLGRLRLPSPAADYVPSGLSQLGARSLPVDQDDALAVESLPLHHGDPFDRMLVAQARRRQLTLVTVDRALQAYDVDVLHAD